MAMCARAVALWCALALAAGAGAAAYTIDCNHEYADCDTELSKLTADEDETSSASHFVATTPSTSKPTELPTTIVTSITTPPTRTSTVPITTENGTEVETVTEDITTEALKPKPRLLNLSVDELKNFAIALHNRTEANTKKLTDLSDVTLDGEEDSDYEPSKIESRKQDKDMADKFYSNLQAPFHPLLSVDRSEEAKDEQMCKENEVLYKVGERIDRACEESCECSPGGVFDCSPRCKHPYIRRGRRLNDPLCFESPIDECCSIIACATGNGESKVTKLEVCRYGNDTYPVGTKWNVGCEQKCSCEKNSVVTCKPRCNRLPPSDKCINVQDPNDACCEVQVCDVSQDVHEEPGDNATSSTSTTESPSTNEENPVYMNFSLDDPETTNTTTASPHLSNLTSNDLKSTMRPLVLTEPIGSVKVLQNNSVQVNLMYANSSKDPIHLLLSNDGGKSFREVELKYDNIILNLERGKDYILKTKETGTKFNFTITSIDANSKEQMEELIQVTEKIGCHQDGKFYEVGEEFHIGCSELCECTGAESRECAVLECPSHVGLELVSKGCVRWAPSPPPHPPNCCPRAARCLSDGTCHYKEVAIPNWTEVPISLTGCEQRCFCENGELDCQEVCTPLPPLPPQTLRCPPLHRPAPVNISDEDCCKQWGCVPNTDDSSHSYTMPTVGEMYYVTPVVSVAPITGVLPLPPATQTDPMNFYKHLRPVKTMPKILKTLTSNFNHYTTETPEDYQQPLDNITVFSVEDPVRNDAPNDATVNENQHFNPWRNEIHVANSNDEYIFPVKPDNTQNVNEMKDYKAADNLMHDFIRHPTITPEKHRFSSNIVINSAHKPATTNSHSFDTRNMFMPTYVKNNKRPQTFVPPIVSVVTEPATSFFKPLIHNHSMNQPEHFVIPLPQTPIPTDSTTRRYTHSKQVTVLKTKELKLKRPIKTSRWGETNMHVLTKLPNPYETVLMRATSDVKPLYEQHLNTPLSKKAYSPLDLEHMLSQIEVESEVNRNLERSADKNEDGAAGTPPPDFGGLTPQKPQQPTFLPTIPPEIHFPDEDSPDYEQNKIQRPTNPLVPGIPGLPPGLPVPPNYGEENKKLTVITLVSDSPTSVKMLFGLPPVLVGLRGSVDLRYTDKPDDDISRWYSQVFAPADEVLTTSRLEFRLTGLKPDTVYKVRGKLYLHNLPVEPESEVYSIRTLELPKVQPVENSRREVDSRLTVLDVNDTVAHISWRRFTEEELQYIDAIQVRYRPVGTPIYSMTELLHHSRAAASLHELRAGSRYEASLILVPPPRATTELLDPTVLEFTTAPHVDPYDWSVSVEARSVGAEAAELTWRGIPSPAERWVRVYRAAHACGGARREHDAFRLAARDLPPSITLSGLDPDTRCRVWLELFLTNGKVKTSNVLEIHTKSLDSPEPIDNVIEASSVGGRGTAPRGDYYGALVVVGVVAALGALTSLLLLLVVVRRHRPRSVPITPVPTAPRESSLPPYDNPAYKLELQQETMDL